MLTGDGRAVGLVREAVAQHVTEVLVEVPGGARGDGVNQDAFDGGSPRCWRFRARRRDAVLDRFREAQGRGEGAVTRSTT